MRDEEKYVDLPTLTAAIERDATIARAYFAQARRRPDRHRPNLTRSARRRAAGSRPFPEYTPLKKTMSDQQSAQKKPKANTRST
jgi:hypothetical protein